MNKNISKYKTIKQCCGSGMFIPDPGSWFLPIPDPGSKNSNKRQGWKKLSCHTFFGAINFTKFKWFYFWKAEEKNLGQFSKNCITFYKKYFHLALKHMGLGSGIRKKPIPDPGSRVQKGTVSHAICLPPPGIKPGSPASQAGTLPKELSRQLTPVLQDPGFLSQIPDPDF